MKAGTHKTAVVGTLKTHQERQTRVMHSRINS